MYSCEGERSPQFASQIMGSGEPVKISGNLKTISDLLDRCHESSEASHLQLQQGQRQVC